MVAHKRWLLEDEQHDHQWLEWDGTSQKFSYDYEGRMFKIAQYFEDGKPRAECPDAYVDIIPGASDTDDPVISFQAKREPHTVIVRTKRSPVSGANVTWQSELNEIEVKNVTDHEGMARLELPVLEPGLLTVQAQGHYVAEERYPHEAHEHRIIVELEPIIEKSITRTFKVRLAPQHGVPVPLKVMLLAEEHEGFVTLIHGEGEITLPFSSVPQQKPEVNIQFQDPQYASVTVELDPNSITNIPFGPPAKTTAVVVELYDELFNRNITGMITWHVGEISKTERVKPGRGVTIQKEIDQEVQLDIVADGYEPVSFRRKEIPSRILLRPIPFPPEKIDYAITKWTSAITDKTNIPSIQPFKLGEAIAKEIQLFYKEKQLDITLDEARRGMPTIINGNRTVESIWLEVRAVQFLITSAVIQAWWAKNKSRQWDEETWTRFLTDYNNGFYPSTDWENYTEWSHLVSSPQVREQWAREGMNENQLERMLAKLYEYGGNSGVMRSQLMRPYVRGERITVSPPPTPLPVEPAQPTSRPEVQETASASAITEILPEQAIVQDIVAKPINSKKSFLGIRQDPSIYAAQAEVYARRARSTLLTLEQAMRTIVRAIEANSRAVVQGTGSALSEKITEFGVEQATAMKVCQLYCIHIKKAIEDYQAGGLTTNMGDHMMLLDTLMEEIADNMQQGALLVTTFVNGIDHYLTITKDTSLLAISTSTKASWEQNVVELLNRGGKFIQEDIPKKYIKEKLPEQDAARATEVIALAKTMPEGSIKQAALRIASSLKLDFKQPLAAH